MSYETFNYKGFAIEIKYDQDALNPIEEYDQEPPMLVSFDRTEKAYNDDKDYATYLPSITREEVRANLDEVKRLLGYKTFSLFWEKEGYRYNGVDFVEVINEELQDRYGSMSGSSKHELLCEVLSIKSIKHYSGCVTGHCQGDYVDVVVIGDQDWIDKTGIAEEQIQKSLEISCELYRDWALGDCFGYVIDNELEDSCWGFYGNDFDKNGLLEYAQDAIDCYIESKRKARLKKLKTLIQNAVPLIQRERILAAL